eukprot:703656-Pyramimonas_sp.AAC.1
MAAKMFPADDIELVAMVNSIQQTRSKAFIQRRPVRVDARQSKGLPIRHVVTLLMTPPPKPPAPP